MTKRLLVSLALILMLVSCGKDPIGRGYTNNPDISVDYLFEVDGCKVYRFYDHEHPVYFTNCSGRTEAQHRSGGKNSTTEVTESINVR